VRAQVVLQAEAVAHRVSADAAKRIEGDPLLDSKALAEARKGLGDLIGWPKQLADDWSILRAIAGWILTAIAISLGASFWFDLLNKLMVVRSTVKHFEKSPAEGSEDRSGATPSAEKLEPKAAAASGTAVAAGAATISSTGGTLIGSVRLAVESSGMSGLVLTIDGQPATLPSNGLTDLPLTMGPEHRLELTATDAGGKAVSWSQVVRVTLDNDALAIDAQLA
jgi:hypothetical protein